MGEGRRRVRAFILDRDGYRRQLELDGWTAMATRLTTPSVVLGDDPATK